MYELGRCCASTRLPHLLLQHTPLIVLTFRSFDLELHLLRGSIQFRKDCLVLLGAKQVVELRGSWAQEKPHSTESHLAA